MRAAFVVRLGRDTKPGQDYFEGWVEEVDSGNELRFHSTAELLRFLGQHFQAVFGEEQREPGEPLPNTFAEGEEDELARQISQTLGSTCEGREE